MNIAILGAGRVGFSIADLLCRMEHSVTVVDNDPERVAKINEELDVRAIVGSASDSEKSVCSASSDSPARHPRQSAQ